MAAWAKVKIIKFHLGYDSQIREAEREIEELLLRGWRALGAGGSMNAGFVCLAVTGAGPDNPDRHGQPEPEK